MASARSRARWRRWRWGITPSRPSGCSSRRSPGSRHRNGGRRWRDKWHRGSRNRDAPSRNPAIDGGGRVSRAPLGDQGAVGDFVNLKDYFEQAKLELIARGFNFAAFSEGEDSNVNAKRGAWAITALGAWLAHQAGHTDLGLVAKRPPQNHY